MKVAGMKVQESAVTVSNPQAIRYIQFCAQLLAADLELKGLKHSSGRSMLARLKRDYHLKGNRESVMVQLKAIKSTWSQQLDAYLNDSAT